MYNFYVLLESWQAHLRTSMMLTCIYTIAAIISLSIHLSNIFYNFSYSTYWSLLQNYFVVFISNIPSWISCGFDKHALFVCAMPQLKGKPVSVVWIWCKPTMLVFAHKYYSASASCATFSFDLSTCLDTRSQLFSLSSNKAN